MSPEFWAILGGSGFVALNVCIAIKGARDAILGRLDGIDNRLHEIDSLIVRIPGVEDYESPDGLEWHAQHKKNPDASIADRRNWIR